jgi:hypothetical protein
MSRLGARLAQERGWGLISSVLVLGILLSLALPLVSLVDGQQRQSAHERRSESSFNLAEAAFDAGLFVLSSEWPVTSLGQYPRTCTHQSASLKCPNAAILDRIYSGPDYRARGWTVRYRDDGARFGSGGDDDDHDADHYSGGSGGSSSSGGDYYDADWVEQQPSWDANGNAKMWIRADGRAAGRDRTVVALVRRQDQFEPFPRNSVTSGWFATGNNGRKLIVDTKGPTAQSAPIAVRCKHSGPPPSPCLNYRRDAGQVAPETIFSGYGGNTAVAPAVLDRFRARAKALGTYSYSCPDDPEGELVFVETGDCHYAGGGTVNTERLPGVFMVGRGTIKLTGSLTFYGLLYAANQQRSIGEVVRINGAATVRGSIAVDWGGGFTVGANGINLVFDDRVFQLLKTFGPAATVQGTWRELPAS